MRPLKGRISCHFLEGNPIEKKNKEKEHGEKIKLKGPAKYLAKAASLSGNRMLLAYKKKLQYRVSGDRKATEEATGEATDRVIGTAEQGVKRTVKAGYGLGKKVKEIRHKRVIKERKKELSQEPDNFDETGERAKRQTFLPRDMLQGDAVDSNGLSLGPAEDGRPHTFQGRSQEMRPPTYQVRGREKSRQDAKRRRERRDNSIYDLPLSNQVGTGPECFTRPDTQTAQPRIRNNSPKRKSKATPNIKERGALQTFQGKQTNPRQSAGRRLFVSKAQREMYHAQQAAAQGVKNVRQGGRTAVQIGKAVTKLIASAIHFLAVLAGGSLLLVLLILAVVGAVVCSPFGIFFSNQPQAPETLSTAEAIAQINQELSNRLENIQSGSYDSIVYDGAPPAWGEVLAVFACQVAGSNGPGAADVAALDADRVAKLSAVFWDMTEITHWVEIIDHPGNEDEDGWTEYILHITITARTAEDMRSFYAFTDYQNEALSELMNNIGMLAGLAGDLTISQAEARTLLDNLPDDLAPERRVVIETACQLVGKVNYFWGGKSSAIGWDDRWGTIQLVTAAGSSTTGSYRPYGLDCSGYVDWAFHNAIDYVIGHGGGGHAQHTYCNSISWTEAMPGDLVFYPGDEHVGIVGGRNEDGELLIIHCAYSYNNVVITGPSGFTSIGRPKIFTD